MKKIEIINKIVIIKSRNQLHLCSVTDV